jgi:predicted alpha/beta superfamily hydrolase
MKKLKIFFIALFIIIVGSINAQTTEIINIPSRVLHSIRKVKICLPSEYNDYPTRKYNVVYLFDAQSDELFNYVKATIDYLMGNADIFISPVILVGIQTDDRRFEFLPKNKTNQPLKDYGTNVKLGGADSLSMHLKEEVFPFIQKKYRCNPYNIGIGHSLGATFLTYSLIKYPDLFNAIIAVSPNYYYDNEQVLHLFDSLATSQILDKKFLYIAHGKGDKLEERFKPSTIKMDSILSIKNIKGLKWQVQSLDNDSHATTPLEGIFKGLIVFNKEMILTDQQIEEFYNDSQTLFIDNFKKHYLTKASQYNIQLPSIEDINHIAYNCFYSGRTKEAIDILYWAISLYPNDSNLYDSMGEIQLETGNKKGAFNFYSKGLEVIERQKLDVSDKVYERFKKGFEDRIKSIGDKK